MVGVLLIILIILWFLGYIHIGITIPDIILFNINGHPITLWNLLIFLVIAWAIGILPSPFRQILTVLLIFWILSVLGIFVFINLSNILVIVIILALLFAIF